MVEHMLEKKLEQMITQESLQSTNIPCHFAVYGKHFENNGPLNQHERNHTEEKPSIGMIHGKHFGMKSSLKLYEKIPSSEKSYSCTVCGKQLRTKVSTVCGAHHGIMLSLKTFIFLIHGILHIRSLLLATICILYVFVMFQNILYLSSEIISYISDNINLLMYYMQLLIILCFYLLRMYNVLIVAVK
ncbi:uncharacterized protein LOC143235297 isoform X1 [Tachypleus tridentatus]|uniref:uncharacterized protein LOC143235297 isoform X1 n=1 Tax=Tachypleus tridentatus TaxID=6853 RepID=UPI003FD58EBB